MGQNGEFVKRFSAIFRHGINIKFNYMKFLKILFLLFVSFKTYSQSKDYTFCYGPIALTLLDGGNAEMIRFNSERRIVSKVTGTFDLYGKGYPTEVLKVQFKGNEYRYDLIRDGYGTPSKIFDNQGREYFMCKAVLSN